MYKERHSTMILTYLTQYPPFVAPFAPLLPHIMELGHFNSIDHRENMSPLLNIDTASLLVCCLRDSDVQNAILHARLDRILIHMIGEAK